MADYLIIPQREFNPDELWMRSISFSGLLKILRLVSSYTYGIKPIDLDKEIIKRGIYKTSQNSDPSKTTLYHCRNTLLRLNLLRKINNRLVVNANNPQTKILLLESESFPINLSTVSIKAFASAVLNNLDCKRAFWDIFIPDEKDYLFETFFNRAVSVVWKRIEPNTKSKGVAFENTVSGRTLLLRTPSEINSIFYGVRYWARDELNLIDEYFHENRGSVMFPILIQDTQESVNQISKLLFSLISFNEDWTIFSIHELIEKCCESGKLPISALQSAITYLNSGYPGLIALIPTSRSFAALTGHRGKQEEQILRNYYRDKQGRYISHIRFHRSIKEKCK